ncbi:hypothetical protein ACQP2T_09370 [Nonomuraea sp. CA-143628]|uniref:hypothetical protein n=1 Tax=Nonomuraea sp. CA-143628 TaxID=3239997 RepID=UPI003D9007BD
MGNERRLGAEDLLSLQEAGRVLRAQGWSTNFSFRSMLAQWEWLVSEIERGYDEPVYEYLNDLSCRDWLAQVRPLITEPARMMLDHELLPLDARFRAATLDDGGEALSRVGRAERPDGWWWKRVPQRLAEDLAAPWRSRPATDARAGRPSASSSSFW